MMEIKQGTRISKVHEAEKVKVTFTTNTNSFDFWITHSLSVSSHCLSISTYRLHDFTDPIRHNTDVVFHINYNYQTIFK